MLARDGRPGCWWRRARGGLLGICLLTSMSDAALAEPPAEPPNARAGQAEPSTAAPSVAAGTTPRLAVQLGASAPPGRNQAEPLTPKTAPPAPAVIRVGGSMIILYSRNYDPEYDPFGNKKKHLVDVWSAGLTLDSKFDRFGMHMAFRMRDRNLRWSPVNSWIEELYASADLIKPDSPLGPLTLKVGKVFMQFGRFWDNSFYGNIQLRDGVKLDANWGASLEGTVGARRTVGVRYVAQYFVIDGQINTASQSRDTPAIVQALPPGATGAPQPIGARRRDRFIGKIEPFIKLSETTVLRVGVSLDHFTADYPDTQSAARRAARSRIKDIDNKNTVRRYGVDFAAQVKWFGAWGEYILQRGSHTNAFPVPPRADNPATPDVDEARAGSSSDDVRYWMAGGNVTYDRLTLQYNHSRGEYRGVRALDVPGQPRLTHVEWIHNPSFHIKITDQLRLIAEFPIWKRSPIPGLVAIDPEQTTPTTGAPEVYEKQVLLTIHGRI